MLIAILPLEIVLSNPVAGLALGLMVISIVVFIASFFALLHFCNKDDERRKQVKRLRKKCEGFTRELDKEF